MNETENQPAAEEKYQKIQDAEKTMSALVAYFEKMKLADYIILLQKPGKMLLLNFLYGVSRGFGIVIGGTIFVSLFVILLHKLGGIPFIGKYVSHIVELIRQGK